MTLSQAQSELTMVNAAIASVLTGGLQSYTTSSGAGSRSAQKLSLADLREQRRELEAVIARLSQGPFTVVKFRNPE